MRTFMKWLLPLAIVYGGQTIGAAPAIPPLGGTVTDQAGMFAENQIQLVEQTAEQGAAYTFRILTIDSLQGTDSSVYATDVYRSWKLQPNEVLLLLSKQDRRVEMNFHHDQLQGKINALPSDYDRDGVVEESKLDEFVTVHFIPSARLGDFALASLSLMTATNQLPLASESAAAAPAPSQPNVHPAPDLSGIPDLSTIPLIPDMPDMPDMPDIPDIPDMPKMPDMPDLPDLPGLPNPPGVQNPPNVHPGTAAATFSGPTPNTWEDYLWLPALLLLAAGAWLAIAWHKKRRIAKLKPLISNLMVDISQALQELKPLIRLSEGTTAKLSALLEQQYTELALRSAELQKEQERMDTLTLRLTLADSRNESLMAELLAIKASAADTRRTLISVLEADKNVNRHLQELTDGLKDFQQNLTKMIIETGFSLNAISEEAQQHREAAARSDKLRVFDPVEAETQIQLTVESFKKTSKHLEMVPLYRDLYRAYPAKSTDTRKRIEQMIQENGIQLAMHRLEPFALLQQSQETMEDMYMMLQAGDMPEVIRLAAEEERYMADAVSMTERQVFLKSQNHKDIALIEEKLAAFQDVHKNLTLELKRICAAFTSEHWEQHVPSLQRISAAIDTVTEELPPIRELSHDSRQEYDKARSSLDNLLSLLDEAGSLERHCTDAFRNLDLRLENAKQRHLNLEQQLQDILSLVRREALPSQASWRQQREFLEQTARQLKDQLTSRPHSLQQIESLIEQYMESAAAYESSVRRMAEEKRKAEHMLRESVARYRHIYSRAGFKLNLNQAAHRHDTLTGEAGRLMALGLYAEAMVHLTSLDELAARMEQDYRLAVAAEEAERRREEAAARARSSDSFTSSPHSSGGSSWDSGSPPSSGTDSSSGSSSGSDSNSSGGSNW